MAYSPSGCFYRSCSAAAVAVFGLLVVVVATQVNMSSINSPPLAAPLPPPPSPSLWSSVVDSPVLVEIEVVLEESLEWIPLRVDLSYGLCSWGSFIDFSASTFVGCCASSMAVLTIWSPHVVGCELSSNASACRRRLRLHQSASTQVLLQPTAQQQIHYSQATIFRWLFRRARLRLGCELVASLQSPVPDSSICWMPGVLFIGPVAPPATAPMCDPSPGASVFALAAPAGELFVVERVVFVCFSQFCGPCCNLGLFQGPSCILAAQVLIYMAIVKKT
jgi:hypothetical protein